MYSYSEKETTRYRKYLEGCPGEKGFIQLHDRTECRKVKDGYYVFRNKEVAKCPNGTYQFLRLCTDEEIPNSAQTCART